MDNLEIKYGSGKIVEQVVQVDYLRRIVESFENIDENVKNDPLISPSEKVFIMKINGSSQLDTNKVQTNGMNNLWLNRCKLRF